MTQTTINLSDFDLNKLNEGYSITVYDNKGNCILITFEKDKVRG